MIGHHHTRSFK